MTVAELINQLQNMPPGAVVLFEGDTGYDVVGDLDMMPRSPGMPDQVVLLPDMSA